MNSAPILTEEVCRMGLVNNDSRLLLLTTYHIIITSLSNTLVHMSILYESVQKGCVVPPGNDFPFLKMVNEEKSFRVPLN